MPENWLPDWFWEAEKVAVEEPIILPLKPNPFGTSSKLGPTFDRPQPDRAHGPTRRIIHWTPSPHLHPAKATGLVQVGLLLPSFASATIENTIENIWVSPTLLDQIKAQSSPHSGSSSHEGEPPPQVHPLD
jgi:hypothetical protein